MQLFLESSKDFDVNLDFQFDSTELISIIKFFSQDKYIGNEKMWEIIEQIGAKAVKESSKNKEFKITKKIYK